MRAGNCQLSEQSRSQNCSNEQSISKVESAEHLKHQVCWRGESCHSHSTNDDYDNDYNDDDDDYDNDYNDDDDDEECEPAVREVLPVVS